jgi:TonB dependent receptor/TonB-dependent Receptor Plug Domain
MRSSWIVPCVGMLVFLAALRSSRCEELQSAANAPALPASDKQEDHEPASATSAQGPPVTPPSSPVIAKFTRQSSTQPSSMFDALKNHFDPVVTSVEVHDKEQGLQTGEPEPFVAGGQEILSTAGAFGDVSRFFQVLPGVVATSDLSNEVLVRGGHPMENLFLVDGIEVPNINHIATLSTTGGFGPMIDTATIQGVKLYTGGYDAQFPERLSSVIEIHTLDPVNATAHAEADFGIEGFGGLAEKHFHGSDLLVSAHHGLLDLADSVGINGLPTYTNELVRLRKNDASGNRLTVLHVAGWDGLEVEPCPTDLVETSTIDSEYTGWRETTGVEWQRVYSSNSFAVAGVSDSEQVEHIQQQDQLIDPPAITGNCPVPPSAFQTVYLEDSNAAFSNANYRYEWSTSRFAFSTGSEFWLQRPHYEIDQPLGAFSPYSAAPVRADSTSFATDFSTGESGSFTQITAHPWRSLVVSAGGRVQTFAFGNHLTMTPRLSVRYNLTESVGIHAAFARYAQMPPYVYLVSYPQNRSMLPMQDLHEVVGMDLGFIRSSEIHVEAYNKIYRDIPASTEYPQVNLHDMVDMLGQQFVWLPMNSAGRGNASGIEISDVTRISSSLVMRGSVAYSRAMFAGLDKVMRPSNFDLPWIANVAALAKLGRGYEISSRYGYATGRPYTPYDMADSLAQNRPIYDVNQMNSLRVPYYSRLDAQLDKDSVIHGLHVEIYLGVNNILNRKNFLAYVWMPREVSNSSTGSATSEIDQMPIFPNFGIRYIFR